MPGVVQVLLVLALALATWWGFAENTRGTALEKRLARVEADLVDLDARSKAAAEQAMNAYTGLSKKSWAAEQQAREQIEGLQGDIKALAASSAAEKQRLEAAASAFRKSAADTEARLRAEVAGLVDERSTLQGDVAELAKQKTATEVALKEMTSLKFLYVAGTPATDISVLAPLKDKGLKIFDQ